MQYHVETIIYLDAGHDLDKVTFVFRTDDIKAAQEMARKAVKQLGFKPWDYGWIDARHIKARQ